MALLWYSERRSSLHRVVRSDEQGTYLSGDVPCSLPTETYLPHHITYCLLLIRLV